jgi:hypothetical protein
VSDESERVLFKGGPLIDYPGWWMIEGRREDESDWWSFVRKADGTYWHVAATDLFPRTGGTMKITPGEQITDARALALCENYYTQVKKKIDEESNSGNRPEQTMRWQQPKTKRTGCVLRALTRMLDVDYGMLATWFSTANRNPQLHEDIKAVLVDHGYDVIETTLEDRGKPRFVEAAYDGDSAEALDDNNREGHAWYVDEDERAWGLLPDPSLPCNSVAAAKFVQDQKLRIERVILIVRTLT